MPGIFDQFHYVFSKGSVISCRMFVDISATLTGIGTKNRSLSSHALLLICNALICSYLSLPYADCVNIYATYRDLSTLSLKSMYKTSTNVYLYISLESIQLKCTFFLIQLSRIEIVEIEHFCKFMLYSNTIIRHVKVSNL